MLGFDAEEDGRAGGWEVERDGEGDGAVGGEGRGGVGSGGAAGCEIVGLADGEGSLALRTDGSALGAGLFFAGRGFLRTEKPKVPSCLPSAK